MFLRIEHKHEPDVFFIYKNNAFYDFTGFNGTTIPVNPVSTFHRYYYLYEELVDNIINNMDYIKYDIDLNKKQIFLNGLVIEIYFDDE